MSDLYNKLNRFNSFPLLTTSISMMLESLIESNPKRVKAIINNELNLRSNDIDGDNMDLIENILVKKYLKDDFGFNSSYFNDTLENKDIYIFTGNSYCGFLPTCNTYLYIAIPSGTELTDEVIGTNYREKYNVSDDIINSLFTANNAPVSRYLKISELGFNETHIKELYYNAHKYSLEVETDKFTPILNKNKRIGNFLKYQLNLVLTRYTGNPMDRIADYSKIHRWSIYAIHILLETLKDNNISSPAMDGIREMISIAYPTFDTSENIPYEFKNIVDKEVKIVRMVELAHSGRFKEFIQYIYGDVYNETLNKINIDLI